MDSLDAFSMRLLRERERDESDRITRGLPLSCKGIERVLVPDAFVSVLPGLSATGAHERFHDEVARHVVGRVGRCRRGKQRRQRLCG